MAKNKYSFKLKSEISELKALYRHLDYFGQVHGLSETLISEVNLCLDELFTNIVSYGFKDDSAHVIKFKINLNGNVLVLKIEDNGMPFNPLIKKESELPANIKNAKIGGLGIHIVKKLMDDIYYQRKRGKNRLTLKRYIHPASHLYKSEHCGSIPSNYYA
jgi:anti-sigma regulatory factor (Ser/Thr protein kinase)